MDKMTCKNLFEKLGITEKRKQKIKELIAEMNPSFSKTELEDISIESEMAKEITKAIIEKEGGSLNSVLSIVSVVISIIAGIMSSVSLWGVLASLKQLISHVFIYASGISIELIIVLIVGYSVYESRIVKKISDRREMDIDLYIAMLLIDKEKKSGGVDSTQN